MKREYKSLRNRGKRKAGSEKILPGHVQQSQKQLMAMQKTIKNLLGPFAKRFHFFELPEKENKGKKKS